MANMIKSRGRKPKSLMGLKFSKLTPLRRTDKKYSNGAYFWVVQCDCGSPPFEVLPYCLFNGAKRDCGKCRKRTWKRRATYEDIEKYLREGKTHAWIGARFGLTRQRVYQICSDHRKELREKERERDEELQMQEQEKNEIPD